MAAKVTGKQLLSTWGPSWYKSLPERGQIPKLNVEAPSVPHWRVPTALATLVVPVWMLQVRYRIPVPVAKLKE